MLKNQPQTTRAGILQKISHTPHGPESYKKMATYEELKQKLGYASVSDLKRVFRYEYHRMHGEYVESKALLAYVAELLKRYGSDDVDGAKLIQFAETQSPHTSQKDDSSDDRLKESTGREMAKAEESAAKIDNPDNPANVEPCNNEQQMAETSTDAVALSPSPWRLFFSGQFPCYLTRLQDEASVLCEEINDARLAVITHAAEIAAEQEARFPIQDEASVLLQEINDARLAVITQKAQHAADIAAEKEARLRMEKFATRCIAKFISEKNERLRLEQLIRELNTMAVRKRSRYLPKKLKIMFHKTMCWWLHPRKCKRYY
jgi:hypothetical protein